MGDGGAGKDKRYGAKNIVKIAGGDIMTASESIFGIMKEYKEIFFYRCLLAPSRKKCFDVAKI